MCEKYLLFLLMKKPYRENAKQDHDIGVFKLFSFYMIHCYIISTFLNGF